VGRSYCKRIIPSPSHIPWRDGRTNGSMSDADGRREGGGGGGGERGMNKEIK
jgi:hypothetical protein